VGAQTRHEATPSGESIRDGHYANRHGTEGIPAGLTRTSAYTAVEQSTDRLARELHSRCRAFLLLLIATYLGSLTIIWRT
jgi:hypothetical protein